MNESKGSAMTLEQSLAAKEIVRLSNQGFGPAACQDAAVKLLKSQGFSKLHSEQIARQMTRICL